ncbi:MAG TPA: hypothetical protein VKU87_06465 [Thermomicrobiaceae bacterium]|nr:hypothetical protein [Thermomicrobiaceae bacterium]
MSPADIYGVVAANFGGVLALVVVLLYLAATDHIVGGSRYREMVADRDYWRAYSQKLGEEQDARVTAIIEALERPNMPSLVPTVEPETPEAAS